MSEFCVLPAEGAAIESGTRPAFLVLGVRMDAF